MYEKLARGHATACIDNLQDYGALVKWLDGPRLKKARDAFERSSYAKKPGRVLKRLTPHLRPCFRSPSVGHWSREFKVVTAMSLASTAENHVFNLTDDTRPLYSERAAVLTELWLVQEYEQIEAGVMICASISHHAIARLVQREAVRPQDLSMEINLILGSCSVFAEKVLSYKLVDRTGMQSFMLPFRDGALVAVFMDMDPARVHKGQKRRRILSVRTWLDGGKLSDLDLKRMGEVNNLTQVMVLDYEIGKAGFARWVAGNMRLWSFADSTPGDQVENGVR